MHGNEPDEASMETSAVASGPEDRAGVEEGPFWRNYASCQAKRQRI